MAAERKFGFDPYAVNKFCGNLLDNAKKGALLCRTILF